MASTAGTTFPLKPVGGAGGTLAVDLLTLECEASETFNDGDIIAIDTAGSNGAISPASVTGASVASNKVFGVANCKTFTSAASIDVDGDLNDDLIQVYPAWPGRRFAGNIMAGAADVDGVAGTDLRNQFGILLDATDKNWVIDNTDTTDPVTMVIEYVSPQFETLSTDANYGLPKYGRHAGVGVTNPRVVFMFLNSATYFSEA